MDRQCNECGESNWKEIEQLETMYPERRSRDRDKTKRRIFQCRECGAEGRKFEGHGSEQFTQAMRNAVDKGQ